MSRLLQPILGCCCLLAMAARAPAFSLLGPPLEPYVSTDIGYMLPQDIGTPKNLGEEYRWNLPVVYYAFDAAFLEYFGSDGVRAVEQAIDVFNRLKPVDEYSADLSEVPLQVLRINHRAQALGLLDLKSQTMQVILEELGVAEADRWVWCLRDRFTLPGAQCPFMQYHVIRRNFDPVTFEPTAYVNGVLYSYQIVEYCQGATPLADAYEFMVDPLAHRNLPVSFDQRRWAHGMYFTGLSRDDVGALRYLWRTNNINWEAITSDSLLFYTNPQPILLISSNLNALLAAAWTNDAPALANLFPGLVINQTEQIFTTEVITNIVAYFTNRPWAPAPWQGIQWATNYVTNYVIRYRHTFGNVVTNRYIPYTLATVVETNVGPCNQPWQFPSAICTNVVTNHVVVPVPSGDYFLLPPNSQCGYVLLSNLAPILIVQSNLVAVASNQLGQQFYQVVYSYFTNHAIVVLPVSCETNVPMNRMGIGKMTFVRANYDSLTGRFFEPITNYYSLNAVTNGRVVRQHLQRVVVTPDWLFTAADLNAIVATRPPTADLFVSQAQPGLAGPGHIEPGVVITYNKVGPMNINTFNPGSLFSGLNEQSSVTNFIWASYDGSTNWPVVYPRGTSLRDLENQVLTTLAISPLALPYAVVGRFYQVGFTAGGGQPPYRWALARNSPGLPAGLELSPGGVLLGVPQQAGIYDFVVELRDAVDRTRLQSYTLVIRLP